MDMLASLLATNYALYAGGPGRANMYYSPFLGHPSQQAAYLTPNNVMASIKSPRTPEPETKTKRDSQKNKNDKVKFSIDNILAAKVKDDDNDDDDDDEEIQVDGVWSPEDDVPDQGDQSDSGKYSWLQCTRYKPPKLPSKYE